MHTVIITLTLRLSHLYTHFYTLYSSITHTMLTHLPHSHTYALSLLHTLRLSHPYMHFYTLSLQLYHMVACSHTCSQTPTQSPHSHTCALSLLHTCSDTFIAHTVTHTPSDSHSYMYFYIFSPALSHTHTVAHTHICSYNLTHAPLHSPHSHLCRLTYTHSLTHPQAHTQTRTFIHSLQLYHTFTHSLRRTHTLTHTSTCPRWTTEGHSQWRGQPTPTLAGWATSLSLTSVPSSLTVTRLHPTLPKHTFTFTHLLTHAHTRGHTHTGCSGPSPSTLFGGPTCPLGLTAVPTPQQQHPEEAGRGVPSQAGHGSPTPGNTHFSAGKRRC